jgi:glycosyltransferase involved in cell wall biosynthesis
MAALALAGHDPVLASRLRSWDGAGDVARQHRIERLGKALAARLVHRYRARPATRPDLWLTYHLYHKAPDWLGPTIADALGIPYVIVEPSLAEKRKEGRWAAGYVAARAAIRRADALISLNGDDREGVEAVRGRPDRIQHLAPFIETAAFARAERQRERLGACYGLDPGRPWLLSVAMMREGAKLASYTLLAEAAEQLRDVAWQLILVGDGPARRKIEQQFAGIDPDRVRFLGSLGADSLPTLYASADLYLWPAIHEAFGIAFLEAQSAGLPIVAGRERGVPEVVRDGVSGVLVPHNNGRAFATAARALLADTSARLAMGRRAKELACAEHDIRNAATRLDAILRHVRPDRVA